MNIKLKFLILLVITLLLFLIGCDTPTEKEILENFPKLHKLTKFVKKKQVVVGEQVKIFLRIENLSRCYIEHFVIQKEAQKGNFHTIGGKTIESRNLCAKKSRVFSYTLVPKSPGILYIAPSKITKIKIQSLDKTISIPKKVGYSNAIKIYVMPSDLSLKQVPEKNKVVIGEKLVTNILIKNLSNFDIQSFRIRLDVHPDEFVILKNIPREKREIKSDHQLILPFKILPKSAGKKKIRVKLKKIRYFEREALFFPKWSDCLSDEIEIEVTPVKLSVSIDFERTELKLMEKVRSVLTVTNKSKVIIEGFEHKFQGDFGSFRLVSASANAKSLSIPPGESRSVGYEYRAEKAGTVKPGKVVLTNLKMNGVWLSSGKEIFASSPVPALHIRSLRLPGFKKPVSIICPVVETYYDQFAIRVLLIALIILVLIVLFRFLLSCFIVEYMVGRFILTLFMATLFSQGLLILVTGCAWFWRIMPPPILDLAAIIAGSVCMSFLFGMFAVKSLAIGSTLSGIAVFASSYLIYTGYRTYQLQEFSNYPLSASLVLLFLMAWAILLWIFRKN